MEIEINEKNFIAEVLESDKPVMMDFYATWCGPCQMMAPLVEEMAKKYEGKAKICKCNADDAIGLSTKYGIMSIPCFVFFKNGEEVTRVVGAVPSKTLEEKLEKLF